MISNLTTDKIAKWMFVGLIMIGLAWVVNYLSAILLPFFIGWLLAYLIYPLVKFIQFKLHFHNRFISVLTALIFVFAVVSGIIYLISQPMYEQMIKLKDLIVDYVNSNAQLKEVPANVQLWIQDNLDEKNVIQFLQGNGIDNIIKEIVPNVFSVITHTVNMILGIIASAITLLYMFFILSEYEEMSDKFIHIVPKNKQQFWSTLLSDVKHAMNHYFRGQGLVSLCMAALFAIGFTIIDFPMAIGLALLIGIMNMVPYLHTLALIPTLFLALLKAADTHQNFWLILLSALAVFIVVQIICDMFITPKIMGKEMNLNPAIIFLSLSVWGMLLGFIGLIIALPLTTIIFSYYKRYVVNNSYDVEPQIPNHATERD